MICQPPSHLHSGLAAVVLALLAGAALAQEPSAPPAEPGEPTEVPSPDVPAAEAEDSDVDQTEALRAILRRAYTNEALLKSNRAAATPAAPPPSSPTPASSDAIETPGALQPAAPPSGAGARPLPAPTAASPAASLANGEAAPAQTVVTSTPPVLSAPAPRTTLPPGTRAVPPAFPPGPGATAVPRTFTTPPSAIPRRGDPTLPSPAASGIGENAASGEVPYLYALSAAPLTQVFDEFSRLTGRTVLHPSNIQGTVTLNTTGNLTREEAIQALQGALALNGITLILQGDKFVKAVPMQNSLQEGGAMVSRDADDLTDSEEYVTQVVQLKAVIPSEVAQLLQSFAKTPQGIVPIDSSQILVIRDYASNVKRMLELIERIDVEPVSEYNLEVIPVKYGRVTDLFDTMSALISGTGGGMGSTSTRAAQQQQGTGALRTVGGFGAGSRLGAAGAFRTGGANRGYQGYQSPYMQQQPYMPYEYTPQGTAAQPTPVGTATGTSFQQRLNTILNRAAGDGEQTEVLGDARIVPDERSNSLIVYANRQDMRMITNIVSKVDVLLAQVLIEGIVVAVVLGDSQDVGVSWFQTPKRFGNDFSGAGAINNGFFGVLTNFPSATPTGFTYWGRLGDDLNVAVQAIATDSKVRILQRPRIQTSHAVPGSFFSGSTVPYVTGFYDFYGGISGGGTRSQVQQVQVGVQLEVTPYITPDDLVVLDIYQDISQLGEFVKIDQNDVPTTTSRTASATLSVRDGETIMLGGYIEDNRTSGKSGVPVLKDIPGLGALFRSSSKKNSRAELILLMKVTVLKSPTDASRLAEIERSLLPGLTKAQREFDRASQPAPTQP